MLIKHYCYMLSVCGCPVLSTTTLATYTRCLAVQGQLSLMHCSTSAISNPACQQAQGSKRTIPLWLKPSQLNAGCMLCLAQEAVITSTLQSAGFEFCLKLACRSATKNIAGLQRRSASDSSGSFSACHLRAGFDVSVMCRHARMWCR